MRLPRRHDDGRIDLPYSNFAYGQTGTPWPVNQAVYVDYMLYDLRGYHGIATEELAVIYRTNQESNGRVGGCANWRVYTPGMLYAAAQNYLLSSDRQTSTNCCQRPSAHSTGRCSQLRRAPGGTNDSRQS